jgi:hypothetical protein
MADCSFTSEIVAGPYHSNYLQLFTPFGTTASTMSSSASPRSQVVHARSYLHLSQPILNSALYPSKTCPHPSPAMQRLKLADDLYHTGASLTGGADVTFRSHARAVPLRVALHTYYRDTRMQWTWGVL